MPQTNDVERVRLYRKSPLAWIRDVFKLVPQPLLADVPDDKPAEYYQPEHFAPFEKGKHLTWQQWLFFRAVEWAIAGKGSRRISIRSGHGTGKSSSCALLILWFLFCFKNSQVPCTAPTADQLKDVLWKEIRLWISRMPPALAALYEWQDQYVRIRENSGVWFARARTGRKENPEALAGVHGEHILMIADEASGIDEAIFETAEGALTSGNIFVILIGNPTRLSGYFYLTHNRDKEQWQTLHFSSEQSPIVSGDYCERWATKYGKTSAQYFVRVRGEFPTSEEDQYIPSELIESSTARKFERSYHAARILGVDVARYGDDATVLSERQGNLASLVKERRGQELMATCGDIVAEVKKAQGNSNPYDAIVIDLIGLGAGVFDRLIELQKLGTLPLALKIVGLNVSEKPLNDDEFWDRTSELWWEIREWLGTGRIDPAFAEQLKARKFTLDSRGRTRIEPKDDMKDRGLQSPDRADSLALTFAVKAPTRLHMQQSTPYQPRQNLDPDDWRSMAGIV